MSFGGVDWSVGEIYGHRAFNVGYDSKLYSPVMGDFSWIDGENSSKCNMCRNSRTPNCSCGFYAYYDPADQHVDGDLYGIIQGYGMVDRGTLGFRAEKCKVVALHVPSHLVPSDARDNISVKKPSIIVRNPRNSAIAASAVIVLSSLFIAGMLPGFSVGLLVALLAFVVGTYIYARALSCISKSSSSQRVAGYGLSNFNWNKFKKQYPDIKIYHDRDMMISDYKNVLGKKSKVR